MKKYIEEINRKLEELNGWSLRGNSIEKTYEFDNFLESIEFINKIAPLAESQNHHPDIDIRYNKVIITLSTHSENGLTEKDFNLAQGIDKM